MRFAPLLVTASFVYGSVAMPVLTEVAVESNSFGSTGAAVNAADNIVPHTIVEESQMSSAKMVAYSPPSSSVLYAKSGSEVMDQSTLTSDFPSVSAQASQIVVYPTALAISSTPIPSNAVVLPSWTNGATRRVQGHSRGILALAFICAILQVL